MTHLVQFPRTSKQWIIAIVSAIVGFFTGGAAITAAQKLMKRVLY